MGIQSPFKQYFEWVQGGIQKLVNESKSNHPFTLVTYKSSKQNKISLTVQVTGKNVFFPVTPEAIYADKAFLSLFSPVDASRITELAILQIAKKSFDGEEARSYKLVADKILANGETMLVFRNQLDSSEIEKSPEEITKSTEFRNKILSDDLFRVGYICGARFFNQIRSKIKSWRSKK